MGMQGCSIRFLSCHPLTPAVCVLLDEEIAVFWGVDLAVEMMGYSRFIAGVTVFIMLAAGCLNLLAMLPKKCLWRISHKLQRQSFKSILLCVPIRPACLKGARQVAALMTT